MIKMRHIHKLLALAVVLLLVAPLAAQDKSLVERLGFAPDAQVLIINGDDFGMNHADTDATIAVMKTGGLTSATIMVPCGWFPMTVRFAKETPQANLGLHITLTSEWGKYKWGPVIGRTAVPGLVDELGYFFPDVLRVYSHAKLEEVGREVRAQIDRALTAGIDVTHIDSHMGTLQYNEEYHKLYIRIAKEYNLPCRIAGLDLMEERGFEYLIDMADEMGVLHCEQLYTGSPPKPEQTESFWKARMSSIPKGKVSEIFIHAGRATPEMRATTGTWRTRTADSDFFALPSTLKWIEDQGIELISYRELRELQRNGKPMPRVEKYGW